MNKYETLTLDILINGQNNLFCLICQYYVPVAIFCVVIILIPAAACGIFVR